MHSTFSNSKMTNDIGLKKVWKTQTAYFRGGRTVFLPDLLSDKRIYRMRFIFSAANKNTDQNAGPSKNVACMYVMNAVYLHFKPTSVCFVG